MIQIEKSKTADTRTCDFENVTKKQLIESSLQHIGDVGKGLAFFGNLLMEAAAKHDYDKLSEIDWFHSDFVGGFKETGWYDNHRKIHRHHLAQEDGIPDDVNLIDIIEYIVDCVMAGMGRSGEVYDLEFTPELLENAFKNTVELLKQNVEVAPAEDSKEEPKVVEEAGQHNAPARTAVCDNCNKVVDISDGGQHEGCDFVWGRRGWRQLGVYDG